MVEGCGRIRRGLKEGIVDSMAGIVDSMAGRFSSPGERVNESRPAYQFYPRRNVRGRTGRLPIRNEVSQKVRQQMDEEEHIASQ